MRRNAVLPGTDKFGYVGVGYSCVEHSELERLFSQIWNLEEFFRFYQFVSS